MKKIGVVGLGYVGLPLAVEFSKHYDVLGFDIQEERIAELQRGEDRTKEVTSEKLRQSVLRYSANPQSLSECDLIIIAVPTPVTSSKTPDLSPLLSASKLVGEQLRQGSIVVYESTVYPGATEEECIPLLEKHSGLRCGVDFKVGYSPERINPGDQEHTLPQITKVVSGMDEDCLEVIAAIYGSIIEAGVFKASSIKVAEAAKVIENTQRDLNIALMNELALIFDRLDIPTKEVLEAAGTKWNFLKFFPGLVGGHCIGVDPYYLTHKALEVGYQPSVILAGRKTNDSMGEFIAQSTIRQLSRADKRIAQSKVLVLGLSFKEDIPDVRNTKVVDIYHELQEWGCHVDVYDPIADRDDAIRQYKIELIDVPRPQYYDAIVLAVPHQQFFEHSPQALLEYLEPNAGVFVDVKSYVNPKTLPSTIRYWSL